MNGDPITDPPYYPAKYQRQGRIKQVNLIVIHSMEAPEKGDTAERVAKYFQNPPVQASAHYCLDNNSVIQCVWDSNTAFACKNANANGLHLEHAGYAKQKREEWLDTYGIDMLNLSAQLGAYLCNKYDIPPVRARFASATDPTVVQAGFCGHVDVPNHGHHWDPGPGFPWDFYLERVKHHLAPEMDNGI